MPQEARRVTMPPTTTLDATYSELPRPARPTPLARPAAPARGRRWVSDPRHFQLAVLGALLLYGVFALDFEVRALQALAIGGVALGSQLALGRWLTPGVRFDPRSAGISALSLCLLL